MEAIEDWLWVFGGIISAAIVVISAYNLLSNYLLNSEKEEARAEMERLMLSIDIVCAGALNTEQTITAKFPIVTQRVYEGDDQRSVCIETKGTTECTKTQLCQISFDTIDFDQKPSLMEFANRIAGKAGHGSVQLDIKKTGLRAVKITNRMTL